ncbi:MAG: riboflavin synthase [Deinococcales bacterium]|nr:riboflavin synthase [Deinococcales bacterium]
MFTGIVEEIGKVARTSVTAAELQVYIEAETVLEGLAVGDSIAVSGCCLTVVTILEGEFKVELSKETTHKTSPNWQPGAQVNLERATRLEDRLGGHIVTGHVEGIGTILHVQNKPASHLITVQGPESLAGYLVPKGSITVDGVSLTIVDVGGPAGSSVDLNSNEFTISLVPHTLKMTTLGNLERGSIVNLEADPIAKYVERLILTKEASHAE